MPRDPVDPTDLLHDLRRGMLAPERYSTISTGGRAEPTLVALVLASTAVLLGIALGGGSVRAVASGAIRVLRGPR